MLERLFAQREPVGAALVTLKTNLTPLTSEEYQRVNQCLGVMCHFNEAYIELSEEKRVSGSKVIPLIRMLRHAITSKTSYVHDESALLLCNNLLRLLSERMSTYETMSVMTLATLLDPRFKTTGFCSQSNALTAVRRLTAECAAMIRAAQNTPSTSSQIPSSQPEATGATGSNAIHSGLWDLLDINFVETRKMTNATADATVEVQRYLSDPNIPRTEDPLHFWATQKGVYPHLRCLALEFVCTPASSVPHTQRVRSCSSSGLRLCLNPVVMSQTSVALSDGHGGHPHLSTDFPGLHFPYTPYLD